MAHSISVPDGDGVISKHAHPGKVLAFYATLIGGTCVALIAALAFLGFLSVGPNEAHGASVSHALEAKVDAMAADVRDVKSEQARQAGSLSDTSRDIAVIKRQLGLDGLGAPPVRLSVPGR